MIVDKEKADKLLKLVKETPAEEIHHLIEWLLLDEDDDEDPVI